MCVGIRVSPFSVTGIKYLRPGDSSEEVYLFTVRRHETQTVWCLSWQGPSLAVSPVVAAIEVGLCERERSRGEIGGVGSGDLAFSPGANQGPGEVLRPLPGQGPQQDLRSSCWAPPLRGPTPLNTATLGNLASSTQPLGGATPRHGSVFLGSSTCSPTLVVLTLPHHDF